MGLVTLRVDCYKLHQLPGLGYFSCCCHKVPNKPKLREEVRFCCGPWFEGTVYHGGEGMEQEHGAAAQRRICSQREERWVPVLSSLSFSISLEPQALDWCCLHLGQIFTPLSPN